MSEDVLGRPSPAGWAESLKQAKAEIAAGQTVAIEPVLERLRASLERSNRRREKAAQKA